MTQVAQWNNHVLQMLKRLRETLDNEKKKYADKVNVLVMTWERIAASAREQRPLAAICIVEKMYKDTLSIMLQGEWPKMSPVSKTHLVQMLHRCRKDLCKEMPWLNSKFRKLLELVNDPWTLPSLERILHRDPSPATPEQIVEFCESERGLLIVTRLTMLCSSRCEKVAIKLAEACFGALSGGNARLLGFFTTNEYNFIFDIYLCLLYKYKKLEFIINALKTVSVEDGYYLVVRLRKRSDFHEQKIWKFSHQVATVASRYFVTVSMLARTIPNSALLKNLISDWLSMCKPGENNIENEVRKVIQPAETSEHIYLMAEVLTVISQKLRNKIYSSLIMELYIRALTADINYLERVKLQNDKEQMTAYEKHLASKFLALADLVKDHSGVRREFVLTAFSIYPSAEIYRRVEEEAVASGKASPHSMSHESIEVGVLSEGLSSLSSEENEGKDTVTDYSVNNDSQDSGAFVEISNRCPLHLPYDGIGPEGKLCFQCGDFTGAQTLASPVDQQQKKKERSLDALILIKGNTVTESLNYDVLSAPSQVLEAEKLGLSSQVCADLVTLLGSNRYHLLTWVLEWGELSSRCLRYMDEADTIKSGKKELKFLDIDYNQYKDWPENDDEADCIEKGYEQWLEEDNTETDFDTDSKRSITDDSEELMIKTAIKRSQKQMGRYAESSSDSEDSRSRPRNRKRGRPRKRLKSYSDSGSVSDSLGSDGQKQKPSGKKLRTKSKGLRKTMGRLKVLEEMTSDSNNLSPSNDCLSPEMIASKVYGLPASANGRSDPTVLRSLRAFRPNAHKTRNDLIQSATESCYNSKAIGGKIVSDKKSAVFDCNDNKFITKGERFTFGSKDVELHFRTGGVKTKQYNDAIRTIKEDLMSVSNIPNVANYATVNVVHVHDSPESEESSQNVESSPSGEQTPSPAAPSMASRNPYSTSTSMQKPRADGGESPGSQLRKSTSSQNLSQNAVMSYSSSPVTTSSTILTSALTRVNPANRPGGAFLTGNQILSTATGSKVIGQPQYLAIVNRNAFNQTGAGQDSNLDGQSVTNAVAFVNSSSVKSAGQHFITQATRAPVQPGRVVAVPTADSSRFLLSEGDRPNVILSKNFVGVQNVRTPAMYNHVVPGLNNGANQVKKAEDSSSDVSRPDVPSLNAGISVEDAARVVTNAFESTVRNNMSPSKGGTMLGSKPVDFQKHASETAGPNLIAGSNFSSANASKSGTLKPAIEEGTNFYNKNNSNSKNSAGGNVLTNQSPQMFRPNNSKPPHTVILQSSLPQVLANRNPSLIEVSGAKRNFSLVKVQTSINNVEKTSSEQQEETASLSGATTTANFGRNYGSSTPGKTPYNEVVRIVQGVTGLGQGPQGSIASKPETKASAENQTFVGDGGQVIAIIDSSPNAKLDSTGIVASRNLLATVSKRNLAGMSPVSTSTSAHYSRNPVETTGQGEGVQNVMISQSSNSSTIHYTVVNPMPQEIQQDGLNSISGDLIERVADQTNFDSSQSMGISPLIDQIENPVDFPAETEIPEMDSKNVDGYGSAEEGIETENNRVSNKSNSSPSSVQTEGNFIRKQVLNNQKITILVENNEGGRDKSENRSKAKSSEFLCREDQRTCITFRAIKRTQSEAGAGQEFPAKKKSAAEAAANQNGNEEDQNGKSLAGDDDSEAKTPSESLCQYLVLEAINDPAGALPKFNQAFGKSYQVKIPQAMKPTDAAEVEGNGEGMFGVTEQGKPEAESAEDEMQATSLAGETPREMNAFEIVQKPVKSVYIDKEVKLNLQQQTSAANKNERDLDSAVNISTIQMTEVQQQQQQHQQPGASNYQNLPPAVVARSSVVQQLLRKIPATTTTTTTTATGGATPSPTLQAVNSVNSLTKQMKSQDVVSGSTLIYATETRAQSQIVIQRAVGRVNTSGIGQVAPVIYAQNPRDHATSQTQTLLLAAVPAGTRGVAPGTQLLRIPSSSGVWKMTSSVNPPRIVQLRPQNLVLQSGQDQGLLMQSGQSVLLQHFTSLPVKPIGVVASNAKADQPTKMDVKNDIYNKPGMSMDDSTKIGGRLEVDQSSAKSETSSPAATVSEHETVSLMKDIKEFENVFEETKLKFEMEEQQGVCMPEVENIPQVKNPISTVSVQEGSTAQPIHQTVLVQPQLMLHKPQMIITSAVPNQQAIFTQKVDKQLTLEKEPEKRLILTAKPKLAMDEASQSRVAVAYVSHSNPTSVSVQKPLVVVTNYAQPPTSPAPSITSQNSSSPTSSVSFTSTGNSSSCKTSAKSKSRGVKTVLNPSKSPPVAKPQQKPQEDANTAQKIYAILEEYAVQLRNSPDMNNRPAPRRRSNPPASANTKRKKTVCKNKESFSDGDDTNFVEDSTDPMPSSEDSSSGVTVLQVYVSSSH